MMPNHVEKGHWEKIIKDEPNCRWAHAFRSIGESTLQALSPLRIGANSKGVILNRDKQTMELE